MVHWQLLAVCLLSFTIADTHATCNMLSDNLDEARIQLSRAATEKDLDFARIYASRAQGALDDLAYSAMDCRCSMAHSGFDGSSTRTRRARDAGSPRQFSEELNHAVTDFNAGLDALRACAAQGTLKRPS
jgi:hypothetical protein